MSSPLNWARHIGSTMFNKEQEGQKLLHSKQREKSHSYVTISSLKAPFTLHILNSGLRALTACNSLTPPAGLVMFHAFASPAKLFVKGQFLWYSQVSRYMLLESNTVAKNIFWMSKAPNRSPPPLQTLLQLLTYKRKQIWHVLDCILEEVSNCLKESLLS